jgi:hypothetical protein
MATGSKDGKVPKDPKDDEDKDPKDAEDAKDPKDAKDKDGIPGKARSGSKKALKTPLPVDEEDDEDAAQDEQVPEDDGQVRGQDARHGILKSPPDASRHSYHLPKPCPNRLQLRRALH